MKTGVAASWRQPGGPVRFAAAFLTAGRCVCPCQPMLTSTRKARGISDAGIAPRSRRRVKRVIGSASCGELLFAARKRSAIALLFPCRLSQETRYCRRRRYLGRRPGQWFYRTKKPPEHVRRLFLYRVQGSALQVVQRIGAKDGVSRMEIKSFCATTRWSMSWISTRFRALQRTRVVSRSSREGRACPWGWL